MWLLIPVPVNGNATRWSFLLAQPIPTHWLVMAKAGAAATFAFVGAVLSILMIPVGVRVCTTGKKLGIEFSLSAVSQAQMIVTLVPLALLASILQLFVSFRAKSFKEAQTISRWLCFYSSGSDFRD